MVQRLYLSDQVGQGAGEEDVYIHSLHVCNSVVDIHRDWDTLFTCCSTLDGFQCGSIYGSGSLYVLCSNSSILNSSFIQGPNHLSVRW